MTTEELIGAARKDDTHAGSEAAGCIVRIRLADATAVDDDELVHGQVLVPQEWNGARRLTSWWGPAMDELVIEPEDLAAIAIDDSATRQNAVAGWGEDDDASRTQRRWIRSLVERLRARRLRTLRVGVDVDGVITRKDWKRDPWRKLNGWEALEPLDASGLDELRQRTHTHKWEVYAITSRPASPGRTVQHQTRRWLTKHDAYELSPVINPDGRRARVAAALELDWLIDDTLDNCTTTALETDTRAIWIASPEEEEDADIRTVPNLSVRENLSEAIALIDRER